MAHFVQLDENNIVIQSIVVDDKDTSDSNGVEVEEIGISFCKSLFGEETKWKKNSYNGNIRFRHAGIGYYYDEELDAFIEPKPFDSWIFNKETAIWESPIGPPPSQSGDSNLTLYIWDENLYQSDNSSGWVVSPISLEEQVPPE